MIDSREDDKIVAMTLKALTVRSKPRLFRVADRLIITTLVESLTSFSFVHFDAAVLSPLH